MKTIKITYPSTNPIQRQIPVNHLLYSDYKFVINESIKSCDYWVVFDTLVRDEETECSPNNTFLFLGEPPSVKHYSKKYLNNFANVVSCHRSIRHKSHIISNPLLAWFVGLSFDRNLNAFDQLNYWSYDDLKSQSFKNKSKTLAIITSNKILSKGHRKRVEFVELLQHEFGGSLDVYGHGYLDIADKLDVLKEYKYTIVIENGSFSDYWTEKLADAFLCECFPIYYGCTNIYKYFPKESLSIIDINKPVEAIKKIKAILDSNFYEQKRPFIINSKRLVLENYNMFTQIIRCIKMKNIHSLPQAKSVIRFSPERLTIFDKIRNRLVRFVG